MTRDDVIRMAREAGVSVTPPRSGQYDGGRLGGDVVSLERFATLVAADANAARIAAQTENEALKAKLAASGVAELRAVLGAVREAVLAEREACAQVCESFGEWRDHASIIRARGAT